MRTNSTAKVVVQVQGARLTYGNLGFLPIISTTDYAVNVNGFKIRRGGDEFDLDDLPLSKCLPASALDDILLNTFEMDDEDRSEYLEVDLVIPDYDERARLHCRASEHPAMPDHVIFEAEDSGGDWLPIEDILLNELLPPSFVHLLEASAMSRVNDHTLDYLPIAAE